MIKSKRQGRGRIPLVIGATGHRSLPPAGSESFERIKNSVEAFFLAERAKYPHTPFIVLSAMAPGADSLIASLGLDHGCRVLPVLPMPLDTYKARWKADFEKHYPYSIRALDKLLNHARAESSYVQIPSVDHGLARRLPISFEVTSLEHLLAGAFVAEHCQILLALWNGKKDGAAGGPASIGGTAQNVFFQRTGRWGDELASALAGLEEPYWLKHGILDEPETGLVYHINTEEAANARQEGGFLAREGISKEKQEDFVGRFERIYRNIDDFNRELTKLAPRKRRDLKRSAEYLLPQTLAAELPEPLRRLRRTYAMVDMLALYFRDNTHRMLRSMSVMVFLAVTSFALYAHLFGPPINAGFLAGYIGVLMIADFLFLFSERRKFQDKYQDFRALAEGLRVQFFWRLAGLAHSTSNRYLRKQKSELSWISNAVRNCGLFAAGGSNPLLDLTREYWVRAQVRYFNAASVRDANEFIKLKEFGSGMLLVSLLLAVYAIARATLPPIVEAVVTLAIAIGSAHLILKIWQLISEAREEEQEEEEAGQPWLKRFGGHVGNYIVGITFAVLLTIFVIQIPALLPDSLKVHIRHSESQDIGERHEGSLERRTSSEIDEDLLIIAMGLTAFAGVLFHNYAEKKALAEQAKQYRRMRRVFARADRELEHFASNGDEERARALLLELGTDALSEHGDWVMLHRERPMELPKAEI